jgi:hypothetical protein
MPPCPRIRPRNGGGGAAGSSRIPPREAHPPAVGDYPNALVRWTCNSEWRRLGVTFRSLSICHAAPRHPQAGFHVHFKRTPCSDHLPSTSKVASLQLLMTLPIISDISSSASSA